MPYPDTGNRTGARRTVGMPARPGGRMALFREPVRAGCESPGSTGRPAGERRTMNDD
ncbi:hypothetical protein NXX10_13025 [Bacteroides xylanisolvens]|nr:hypothetical protein [Bacteroides xylanisolvens]